MTHLMVIFICSILAGHHQIKHIRIEPDHPTWYKAHKHAAKRYVCAAHKIFSDQNIWTGDRVAISYSLEVNLFTDLPLLPFDQMFTVCIWLLQFGGVSSSISAFNILRLLQPECLWDQCFHLGLLLGWLETWNISASKSHRTRSVSRPVVTGCVDLLEVTGICCKINCQSRHWECCLSK